jgi:hypothetical protein
MNGRPPRILAAFPAALVLAHAGSAPAQGVGAIAEEIRALDAKFPSFVLFPDPELKAGETAFLYADTKRVVHLYESDRGTLRERWKSFPLEGTVKALFAQDLDRDGGLEIVAYTSSARLYVFGTEKFELLWESVEEKWKSISAMAVADVDRDPALELILVADNKLVYYDGTEYFREKEGRDFLEPSALLVGDVDGDDVLEIVTNDGYVVDTVTLNIEWATDGFGYPISLFDLDGDGVVDVVGEAGGSLTFWNVADRREIW